MILIIPLYWGVDQPWHIYPNQFQASQGVRNGVIPSDLFHHKVRYLWSDEARRFPPRRGALREWPRGLQGPSSAENPDESKWGRCWTPWSGESLQQKSSLCYFRFFFVLVDGVRCDFVEGYIFCLCFGANFVGSSISGLGPLVFLKKIRFTSQFFHAFTNCEFQPFVRIQIFGFIIQLIACTFFYSPEN